MLELAIARHRGRRRVQSTRPRPHRRAVHKTSRFVVVADDDVECREALAELLEHAGFSVDRALDGRDALLLVRTRVPDALVLDLSMPGLDGFDVARALRSGVATRQIPVVAVTGRFSSEAMVSTREPGLFASILLKPVSGQRLVRRLRQLTDPPPPHRVH